MSSSPDKGDDTDVLYNSDKQLEQVCDVDYQKLKFQFNLIQQADLKSLKR